MLLAQHSLYTSKREVERTVEWIISIFTMYRIYIYTREGSSSSQSQSNMVWEGVRVEHNSSTFSGYGTRTVCVVRFRTNAILDFVLCSARKSAWKFIPFSFSVAGGHTRKKYKKNQNLWIFLSAELNLKIAHTFLEIFCITGGCRETVET